MPSTHSHEEHGGAIPHDRKYDDAPLIVTWEVTRACELECDHCRADATPDRHPDELTTVEGETLLDQVVAFDPPRPIVVFSGGDPLERPDLFELLEYAATNGLRTAVTPAPTAALTQAVLDRFVDAGVHRIALSLDGGAAERHDAFRGEDGSFETIRNAAEYATDIGLDVQINTTVTATTADDLPEIADLVETFGAVTWEVFFLVPVGRGEALEQLAPAEAERVLEWLYRRQRAADFRLITVEAPHYRRIARRIERTDGRDDPVVGSTGDGNGFVFVDHTGTVYPSGFLPVDIGTVPDDDLVDLYREAPLLRALRDHDRVRGSCGVCPYRSRCGGSRARAHAATGDPLASDPLCVYTTQETPHADDR
ncbi:MAG: radical SAM protein [Haloplanus sp.]